MENDAHPFGYCERLGPEFWAEPVNAVTNAAFLVVAVVVWRRTSVGRSSIVALLCAILAAIGVGSFLFHTLATQWAALADVVPILAFILVYLYAVNRAFWSFGRGASLMLTVLFIPYALVVVPLFRLLPFFAQSAGYWPIPLLIGVNAFLLRRRLPQVARGLAAGAGMLILSLIFRSLDGTVCESLTVGTHFLWHILNALMLGWMIAVLHRHLAGSRTEG